MNRLFQTYLLLLAVIVFSLSSCSSKEETEPEFTASYYGEFITTTPIDNAVLDVISPKEAIDFMIANGVQYETTSSVVKEEVPEAERETSKYTVRLTGESVYMITEKEVGLEGMVTQYNITRYIFKVGQYKVTTDEIAPFERYIVVTRGKVTLEVWYNGVVTDNVVTILEFPTESTCYPLYDDGIELEPFYHPTIYKSFNRSDDVGKAIRNSDGTYTLKFDFFTYSLNIETGNFIQTYPEYIEIGKLDKI